MPESTIADLPMVSVIMPVRNEEGYLQRSLAAVLAQDYPRHLLEILVVDGMSTDNTREVVRRFQRADPRVRLLPNPGRIAPTALNAALAKARGEVVVRVDGHCEIAPDYVSKCVKHLMERKAWAVGGPIETVAETPLAEAIATAMSHPFGVGNAAFRTVKDRTMWVDTVAFPAYPRGCLFRLGPFDEELVRNQDDEYNYRLRAQGGTVLLASDVHARYFSRSTLASLWRQYFQYGFWKVRVLQKHPAQMQPRQFVPAFFLLALLGGVWGALLGHPWGDAVLALTLIPYLGLNLAVSASLFLIKPRPSLLALPLIFAILHVSYGAGFWCGCVRFAGRWRPALRSVSLRETRRPLLERS